MKVFLSYDRADTPAAAALQSALQSRGVAVVSDTEFAVGADWNAAMRSALNDADGIVILLSGRTSGAVLQQEAWTALRRRESAIYPVLLDDAGTRNFVWPLIADRQALRLQDDDFGAVADAVARVRETHS